MNDSYMVTVEEELFQWRKKLIKKSNMLQRVSKKAQAKVNEMIPEKAHTIITESIKKMVQATLVGSEYTTKGNYPQGMTLQVKEKLIEDKLTVYRRTAAAEGAGTGAGGFLLSLADFPLLLSIKMKFLFEVAAIHGFDTKNYEERLFLLQVFQLAFSSDEHKKKTLQVIENWEDEKQRFVELDWRVFQQEYREYIDFVKMLQLLPGIGAVVGAYANYNLLDHLGETSKNCYRLRILKESN
ncbi:EcsC family protein [Fredinandcohnia sp. QZ13]|uniref:EcsC family protein n=1 Tax=Fredinandcohnia sp. QZ13 TaxID=3073144 RepID=UPI00285358D3|nr:EcsC family protein [Fredinandcohnia sp. QZ13]MDR4887197.1 EcsC family protein [Fredinandcohnia sp. QZ13]